MSAAVPGALIISFKLRHGAQFARKQKFGTTWSQCAASGSRAFSVGQKWACCILDKRKYAKASLALIPAIITSESSELDNDMAAHSALALPMLDDSSET